MPKEKRNNKYAAIRALFEEGGVRTMKDIEDLSPTDVAKDLKINHSRYIQKLNHPEQFTIQHLVSIANILDLDIELIWSVILKQIGSSLKSSRKK